MLTKQPGWQPELSELRGISQGLSAQLIAAADDLREQGQAIPSELLSRLADYTSRFITLENGIREMCPQLGASPSLDDLENAIQSQQQVQKALEVIESATRLRHREQQAFAPLNRVMALCQSLREELSGTRPPSNTADELIQGKHAVSALLALVREPDSLSDERWQTFQEMVAHQFGRELATAVARGRVTESIA